MGGFVLAASWVAVPVVAVMMTASPAQADTISAALNMHGVNGASSITITEGDSLEFKAGEAPKRLSTVIAGFSVKITHSAVPGLPVGTTLKSSSRYTITFNTPGEYPLIWNGQNNLGVPVNKVSGELTSATIIVNAIVSPTSPVDTPTVTDPGQPTDSGTATGTSTASATAIPSGGTTTTVSGHPVIIATLPNGQIQTFPAGPGLGIPSTFPTGVNRGGTTGPVPSNFPSQFLTGLPTPSTSSSPIAAGIEPPDDSTPPTALAILAIVAFAGVTSVYAYGYLRPATNS